MSAWKETLFHVATIFLAVIYEFRSEVLGSIAYNSTQFYGNLYIDAIIGYGKPSKPLVASFTHTHTVHEQ